MKDPELEDSYPDYSENLTLNEEGEGPEEVLVMQDTENNVDSTPNENMVEVSTPFTILEPHEIPKSQEENELEVSLENRINAVAFADEILGTNTLLSDVAQTSPINETKI